LVEDLRAALKQQLPDYMVPAHIVRMAALPMTPNGKVNRAKLPLPESALPAAAPLAVAESDLERTVASIWQEVLQVPRVGVDQNFFDLGGHSLLTVRVLGRLRETTGVVNLIYGDNGAAGNVKANIGSLLVFIQKVPSAYIRIIRKRIAETREQAGDETSETGS
jgi:hypothetical protein